MRPVCNEVLPAGWGWVLDSVCAVAGFEEFREVVVQVAELEVGERNFRRRRKLVFAAECGNGLACCGGSCAERHNLASLIRAGFDRNAMGDETRSEILETAGLRLKADERVCWARGARVGEEHPSPAFILVGQPRRSGLLGIESRGGWGWAQVGNGDRCRERRSALLCVRRR